MELLNRTWTAAALLALAFAVLGTPGVGLADDDENKKKKQQVVIKRAPGDLVEAPPEEPATRRLPADLVVLPEHMRPGTHTLALEVAQSRHAVSLKTYKAWDSECIWLGRLPGPEDHVGWANMESPASGKACGAYVLQLAVGFDSGPLDQIPAKSVDRAVLMYDEARGELCPLVGGQFSPCWANGDGEPEDKPDGCAVVRVPTWDWPNVAPGGLIPYAGAQPAVRRLSTRAWDVTEPYRWQQVTGAAPLGAVAGFGFLLTGGYTSLDELTGDDSTVCTSRISNIRLDVTYTVPEPSGPPPVVR